MRKGLRNAGTTLALGAVLALGSASCAGELTREGTSASYLVIASMEASPGDDGSTFTAILSSDVITVVNSAPTYFSDVGRVQFALGLKDPGSAATPTTPTQANWITVDRYHVAYVRADGRNTPGVDVPYAFDGAFTATVSGDTTVVFTLVRQQAKQEAPLKALASNPITISALAEVTFYGHDQTGREVSVTGRISVNFANYGD